MKNVKRYISTFLCIALLATCLCVPAFAAETTGYSLRSASTDLEFSTVTDMAIGASSESAIASSYNEHTITFDDIKTMPYAVIDTKMLNEQNVAATIDYVLSLNLSDAGYQYIEDSCLAQLEAFSGDTDGVLTSYTVLTPKLRATMSTYGTVDGRVFYYDYYSTYSKTYEQLELAGADNIKNFINGGVSIALSLGNFGVPGIVFSLFTTLTGVQNPVKEYSKAFTKNYFILDATCRGIYTQNSNGKYGSDRTQLAMVLSDEYGKATPYCVFHTGNSALANPAPTVKGQSITVKTANYDNKNTVLFQASNRFHDTDKSVWTYSLRTMAMKATWA